jgi:hypothetical protein
VAASVLVAAANIWICHRLFTVEFTGLQSNEAAFIAISRFFHDHWKDLEWFPWFDGGMPIQNAYQPVLPALTAAASAISGWSIARAFHVVLATAYCLAPFSLFWFACEWSGSVRLSLAASLAWSLISPAPMLISAIRAYPAGIWAPQRLYNLVYWGEGPHNLALALLPLALLFICRAVRRPGRWNLFGAIVSSAAVVLSNSFGAVGLALGALCTVLALNPPPIKAASLKQGFGIVALVGIAGWLWASPWLPPSLIDTIRRNSWTTRGYYNAGISASLALVILLLVFAAVWVFTRRLSSPLERFVCLFAPWMCTFPLAAHWAKITLVPQAERYQSEMELALCLAFACILIRLFDCSPQYLRFALGGVLFFLVVHQARIYRNFAHDLIRPVDIAKTVEYKAARWISNNLPGQRVMVSGDAAFLFNVFSDNPQLSGGHEPTAPNFMQQVAVYALYTGTNAGERDGPVSVFWLKAFGNGAITVPGPETREYYKPFFHPNKFDGLLPVLWREDGDAIFEVPQRSRSLAHVIPAGAMVTRQPIHGLDLEPAAAYVNALDDPALPLAELEWRSPSRALIRASLMRGQLISVQETFDTGWRALSNSRRVPVKKDGLGLIIIDPGCEGDCRIELDYGATPETWLCRLASGLITAGLLCLTGLILLIRRLIPGLRPGTVE